MCWNVHILLIISSSMQTILFYIMQRSCRCTSFDRIISKTTLFKVLFDVHLYIKKTNSTLYYPFQVRLHFQQLQEQLPSPTSAWWVFSCFRIPTKFNMDYMIFNIRTYVRTYVIILMCAYTHGGWAHRQWVSTTFLTWKNSQIKRNQLVRVNRDAVKLSKVR